MFANIFERVFRRLFFENRLISNVTIAINSVRFRVPILSHVSVNSLRNITEPWQIELLPELLSRKNGALIDVGANLGQTLLKLKAVAPEREYIGIEPNPVCIYFLNKIIKLNHIQNAQILPIGVFNENTMLRLSLQGETDSGASVIKDFRANQEYKHQPYIPVYTLDHIIRILEIQQIAVLKIDVEGAEKEVLEGAVETMRTFRPIVMLEILPVYDKQHTKRLDRQRQVEKLIHELGYSILRVNKNVNDHWNGLEPMEQIDIHSDLSKCDYVLFPD